MTEPWASADKIAKHFGVTKDSTCRGIENRGLAAHKIGRLWRFKHSEVDDWVRRQDASVTDDERKLEGGK